MPIASLAALHPDLRQLLQGIGSFAAERGQSAYLVGGFVRDLVLGVESVDVDIMLEHNALEFVSRLQSSWKSLFPSLPLPRKPLEFPRYGTAKLQFTEALLPGLDVLDFSTARAESYPQKGAAPKIAGGDLRADMLRRDFSVNALAMKLSPLEFGEIVDVCGGLADIGARQLRVLHDQSFCDDPARLLRGVRLLVRLAFTLEPKTADLFSKAAQEKLLTSLAPFRRFDEFRKALCETEAIAILAQLELLGLLEQIHPNFRHSDFLAKALSDERASGCEPWKRLLAALLIAVPNAERRLLLREWTLSARVSDEILKIAELYAF